MLIIHPHQNSLFEVMPCNKTCPQHPSLEEILTYDHCVPDIVINYSLILLLQATVIFHRIPAKITACSTFYLWAFQIILCFVVGCVGVSVVWSAQLGILIHHRRQRLAAKSLLHEVTPLWAGRLYRLSLVIGFTSWVYYAIIEEPITTLAHLCAFAMGILLDLLAQRVGHPAPLSPSAQSSVAEPLLSAAY